jgi:RecB family exonuclease
VDAPTAIEMLLDTLEGCGAPEEGDEHALEAVGWLVVATDPAPVAIVTGMNEGVVPATHGSDPLLPDALRSALGLPDGASVAARDAYLLRATVAPRARAVLIAGRASADGDPLHPSRLLLAGDDALLARTVLRFAKPESTPESEPEAKSDGHPGGATARGETDDGSASGRGGPVARPRRSRIVVARAIACGREDLFARCPPCTGREVRSMSVSAFRAYLRSPYAYYLRTVLGLEEHAPPGREADVNTVGSLLHGALEMLAENDLRDCTDATRLRDALLDALGALWAAEFGPACAPVLRLQRRAGEARLRQFALDQAARRAEGWRLLHAEWPRRLPEGQSQPFALGALPLGDEGGMPLRGRIDRIDVHERDGRVAILDYKTGDSAHTPAKLHGRPGKWKDLQLPLYRHLAGTVPEVRAAADDGRLALGYFALPREAEKAGVHEAPWDAEALRDADACAADVARAVRRGEFDDVGEYPEEEGVLGALCALAAGADASDATRAGGDA